MIANIPYAGFADLARRLAEDAQKAQQARTTVNFLDSEQVGLTSQEPPTHLETAHEHLWWYTRHGQWQGNSSEGFPPVTDEEALVFLQDVVAFPAYKHQGIRALLLFPLGASVLLAIAKELMMVVPTTSLRLLQQENITPEARFRAVWHLGQVVTIDPALVTFVEEFELDVAQSLAAGELTQEIVDAGVALTSQRAKEERMLLLEAFEKRSQLLGTPEEKREAQKALDVRLQALKVFGE